VCAIRGTFVWKSTSITSSFGSMHYLHVVERTLKVALVGKDSVGSLLGRKIPCGQELAR